eukprot:425023-Amphidinium_carterae.1
MSHSSTTKVARLRWNSAYGAGTCGAVKKLQVLLVPRRWSGFKWVPYLVLVSARVCADCHVAWHPGRLWTSLQNPSRCCVLPLEILDQVQPRPLMTPVR